VATLKPYRPAGGLGLAPESGGFVRPPAPLTLADKRDLCAMPATLNGAPAAITGAAERFALVVALDGSARAEYSWPTVARMARADMPEHGRVRFGWFR
jgi:hypothetical protein